MDTVLSVILGGGQGTRLFPLTSSRSKPAVPLIGKYRLIDVPISNCIHSGMQKIFVLTQFQSASLHQHISLTYKFDAFSEGFVQILAAQQTFDDPSWYQGTADAVRQNLRYLDDPRTKYVLILSGDQLYRLDFRDLMEQHIRSKADLTVAVLPVSRDDAKDFGVLRIDNQQRIIEFVEKPKDEDVLDRLAVDADQLLGMGLDARRKTHLASMGIYVFNHN
nr:sugar phosphate nucleotidyltransferase [Armatimonadota bacterium]